MSRKLVLIVELDEEVSASVCKANGIRDLAPVEYLVKEMGRLRKSGISLEECLIMDDDDTLRWARYINYLIGWALEHSDEESDGMSPACYDEWCDNEDLR